MPSMSLVGLQSLTFLHIPKCAGSSIASWLRTVNGEYTAANQLPELANVCTEIKYHPSIAVIRQTYPTNFTFTVVRNPWDRAVSAYFYITTVLDAAKQKVIMKLNNWETMPTFDQYIADKCPMPGVLSDVTQPQCQAWINAPVDLIIRFEDIDTGGMSPIQDLFKTTTPLPRLNASVRNADYRVYYNSSTQAAVATLFQEDIDIYKYTF